jgi:hypothetical protein
LEELDGDEALVLICALVIGSVAAVRFLLRLQRTAPRIGNAHSRLALALVPAGLLVALYPLLLWLAASDVRADLVYQILFEAVGAVWLVAVWKAMPATGLSPCDDALDTDNPAAATVVCAAWVGAFSCYGGANIGEGASIWMTLGPAALATGAWGLLWLGLELSTAASEAIAIDRDRASAWRLAGLLVANGLLLGAGAAGDWAGTADLFRSIARAAVPALVLTAAAGAAQRRWRPTPLRPTAAVLNEGVLPGGALAAAAITWLFATGLR